MELFKGKWLLLAARSSPVKPGTAHGVLSKLLNKITMNQIKGLAKLNISEDVLDKLEQAAVLHRRHSRIEFKIVEATDKAVTIQVMQGKSLAEKYFDKKRLVEIVQETFDRFFPGQKVIVRPITYSALSG